MEKRAREKAGLAIFLVLVALGGILLGGYFLTGRSWSVAATMVDDTVGSLDRYTVVAFSGTTPPEEEILVAAKGPSSSAGSSASSSSSGASSSSHPAPSSSSAAQQEIEPEFTMRDAFGDSAGSVAEPGVRESILSIFERQDRKNASLDDENVYVSDVRDLYALKGADGLTLNLSDTSRYAEPIVLNGGNKKIGIFAISSYISRAKLKSTIAALEEDGADTVICIAPRTALLSTYDDIDVVILTNPQEERPDEREHPTTLVVESPEIGDVGVVLLTSNNVPSFKVVKEL